MMRVLYSLSGFVLTPALRLWLRRRVARGKEDPTRLSERFGITSQPRPEGALVWLHAASVGETQSVLTLVRALLEANPALHLLITTGTLTSAALVAQQQLPRTLHQFVPLDTFPAVRRFLAHWQPNLALWVESEFWPQLLWQARAQRMPLLLINARMSARSQQGWQRFPWLIRELLQGFTAIYAGSPEDAARLQSLGARDVQDIGNLKFDAAPLSVDAALVDTLTRSIGQRRCWVAASTHANEEQQISDTHRQLAAAFPDLLTILVPRHAARGDAIATDLRARGFSLAQRSKGEPITTRTQLYLADTMGELGSFYRFAGVAFIGGSLIAHGGHNPLEPARLDCAILTGPHTHNFTTIVSRLHEAGALRIVHDKDDLAVQLAALWQQPETLAAMRQQARSLLQQASGTSATVVQHCLKLLGEGA